MSPAGGNGRARSGATALPLAAILCMQMALGIAFARHTPIWQAPDEPAHFNYVAHVARLWSAPGAWPVIRAADYPARDIAAVMARQIESGTDLSDLRYENHQPPLYYLLASSVYRLPPHADVEATSSRLLALRLSGVLLTLLTTTLAWAWVRLGWPHEPRLAIAAAGFTAFLPMHAAIGAAVNNDVLALPLMAAILVVALAHATGRLGARGFTLLGGGMLGAALLTKLTLYVAALPVALAALLAPRASRRGRLACVAATLGVGAAVASPWWLRNASVYGWRDPLALVAHATAVHGQPTTAAFIADFGWTALLQRAVVFTFDSFWGVFGWMSVFLPTRVYTGLALMCAVSAAGLWRHARGRGAMAAGGGRAAQQRAWRLGVVTALGSLAAFVAYNTQFVQHQGRYLFPALIPLAAAAVLGARVALEEIARGPERPWRRWREALVFACWPLGLLLLAWWSLYRYVMPGLLPAP